MKIQALIFDMDGLLFDSERIVQRTWNWAGQLLGYGNIGEHIYNTLGFNVVRRGVYFREHFGEDFPMEDFNQMTRRHFFEITDVEGIPVKKGAFDLLRYGREQGLKMVVATSSRREYATRLLESTGIMEYLDGCVFGDMVTHAKPDPEIYIRACDIAGIPPENCMALEDAPAGIRSAYGAGLVPVVVPDLVQPSGEILELCFCKVQDLTGIIPILEDMKK